MAALATGVLLGGCGNGGGADGTATAAPAASETRLPPLDCPGDEDTGVSAGIELEPSDDITTEEDGQVIEGLEVDGKIEVRHDDVTIRDVRVLADGHFGIVVPSDLSGDVEGLLIEDTEVVGVAGDRDVGIAQYGDWTARRVEVRGFQDGVKMGSDQVLEESWIHDLHAPEGAHNDGIQSVGGSGSVIRGNTIEGRWQGQTAAIMLQTENRELDDWVVVDNCLSGGGYTLYVEDKEHGAPTDVRVDDNQWTRGSWSHGPTNVDQGEGWSFTGNRLDDGTPLHAP